MNIADLEDAHFETEREYNAAMYDLDEAFREYEKLDPLRGSLKLKNEECTKRT